MSVLTKKLTDALSDKLETPSTSDCTTQLDDYCETLTKVLDELAPLKSCKPKKRMSCKWYTDEIHLMRQLRRKNESIWRKSGLEVHRMININHRNEVNQAIRKAKCDYYITLLEKADVKVAFSTVNRLLASPSPQLPDQLGDGESLCEKFASFFTDKIDRIRAAVDSVPVTNFDLNHNTDLEQATTNTLDYFKETSETEVGKISKSSKSTTCSLDPLPTKIIKKTSSVHIPALTRLINTSFESGIVPVRLKKALVTPILKKHGLDVNILTNKTEFLVLMSPHQLRKYGLPDLQLGTVLIKPAVSVRNLGAHFDQMLTMVSFINHKIKVASYHLRRIGSIRKYITAGICHKLVVALVTSNIDYCNGLLGGLAAKDVNRLQRLQNRAARLVTRSKAAMHITPQRLTLAAHSRENKL